MRQRLALLWAMVCTAVLLTTAAFATDKNITISNDTTTPDGAYSFRIELSAGKNEEISGQVYVPVYNGDLISQMRKLQVYPAQSELTVTIERTGENDDPQAYVIWTDNNQKILQYKEYKHLEQTNQSAFGSDSANDKELLSFYSSVKDMIDEQENRISGDSYNDDNRYALGRLIVRASERLPDDILNQFEEKPTVAAGPGGCYVIQFKNAKAAEDCAYALGQLPSVRYAEPDIPVKNPDPPDPIDGKGTASLQDDAAAPLSWGVKSTHMDQYAANIISRGAAQNITVAVVDTGIQGDHEFVANRVLPGGYDFVDCDDDPNDGDGHGTHVSSTIIDSTPGMDGIKIMAVRVLDDDGCGYSVDVGLGISYAVEHGANVINLSLGGSHTSYVGDAVANAVAKGVTVVYAAGNSNEDASGHCPAEHEEGITVAAVDSADFPAWFTNYGDVVDIAAPGVDIYSAYPPDTYESLSGTSMASPHVAAAAALLLSDKDQGAGWICAQVEAALKGASRIPVDWDEKYGVGILDMSAFIRSNQTAYALLYEDGELVFQNDNEKRRNGVDAEVYSITTSPLSPDYAKWHGRSNEIKKVTIADSIRPVTTSQWFYGCENLTSVNGLENLDVSAVTNMDDMFAQCASLESLDLKGFDTRNVTSMRRMFKDCDKLSVIYADDSFVTGKVTDSRDMFSGCTSLSGGYGTKYSDDYTDKTYARPDTADQPGYFTDKIPDDLIYAILYTDGDMVFQIGSENRLGKTIKGQWPVSAAFDSDHARWYDERQNIVNVIFADLIKPQTTSQWFYGCENLVSIQQIENLDTSAVTDMSSMFEYCSGLSELDVSSLNTERVTNMREMFHECSGITEIDLRNFNTSMVTDMRDMFKNCGNLIKIYGDESFATNQVTQSDKMFQDCFAIDAGRTKYDPNFTDKTYARPDGGTESPGYFYTEPPIPNPDPEPTDTLYVTLYSDGDLEFRNDNTTDSERSVVKTYIADLEGYGNDREEENNYRAWYNERSQIVTVTFRHIIRPDSTAQWFEDCANLTSVRNLENLDVSNVSDMSNMFAYCVGLRNLDLSAMKNTGALQNMESMFAGSQNLETLDLSGMSTNGVSDMRNVFENCANLAVIYVSDAFETGSVKNGTNMFRGCVSLRSCIHSRFSKV